MILRAREHIPVDTFLERRGKDGVGKYTGKPHKSPIGISRHEFKIGQLVNYIPIRDTFNIQAHGTFEAMVL